MDAELARIVGERFNRQRIAMGMTLSELARAANMHPHDVHRQLKGARRWATHFFGAFLFDTLMLECRQRLARLGNA